VETSQAAVGFQSLEEVLTVSGSRTRSLGRVSFSLLSGNLTPVPVS
jgi:hypothetical protein